MAQISEAEYYRRSEFLDSMKTMKHSAFLEIARVLKKNKVVVSENRSGIFFDLAKIPQEVFDELVKLQSFINRNNQELQAHEDEMAQVRQSLKQSHHN